MNACPAEGCKFVGKSEKALASHVNKCNKGEATLALIAEDIRQHRADGRQAKRCRISSPERRLELALDMQEPMDVDLEVRAIAN